VTGDDVGALSGMLASLVNGETPPSVSSAPVASRSGVALFSTPLHCSVSAHKPTMTEAKIHLRILRSRY
jgi:hypothetical protein